MHPFLARLYLSIVSSKMEIEVHKQGGQWREVPGWHLFSRFKRETPSFSQQILTVHLLHARSSPRRWGFSSGQTSHHSTYVPWGRQKRNKHMCMSSSGTKWQMLWRKTKQGKERCASSGMVDEEIFSEKWHLRWGLNERRNWAICNSGGRVFQEEERASEGPRGGREIPALEEWKGDHWGWDIESHRRWCQRN